MDKTDLTKKYKAYYSAKTKPEIIELGKASYLSIMGKGDPGSEEFAEKVQMLYTVAYSVKFLAKAMKSDFVVAKLEGLWWFDDKRFGGLSMEEAPLKVPRKEWQWRLLIRMPEVVTSKLLKQAIQSIKEKKKLPDVDQVEFFGMTEGKVVQMLHVGAFDKEPESLMKMQRFMTQHKFAKAGLHHEIYLSDFRKTRPEKLKTILREPVK
jgi:hypothetical protein